MTATCLPLSAMALGCEPLGGCDWGTPDLARGREAVRCAIEMGITVFDTADVYGLGRGEEELASALGEDRHRVTIVTKGGVRWMPGATPGRATTRRDSSAAYLMSAIDASLRRLRLETIPLYLVHWPDPQVDVRETLDCLESARQLGKIVDYGLSNFEFPEVVRLSQRYPIRAIEGPLSLLEPCETLDDYRAARAAGLTTLTYGPLAQGFLTGKYSAASIFDATDRRHRLSHFSRESWQRHDALLQALAHVAAHIGRTPAQVAIRWVVDSGASTTVIVGARSPEQVSDNVSVLEFSLEADQMERLSAARTGVASPIRPQMVNGD